MPKQLPQMIMAELRKVLSRPTGWAGPVLSIVLPSIVVLGCLIVADKQEAMMQENPLVAAMINIEPYTVVSWSLRTRNFFLMPMVLLLVTAQLFAGERSNKTLRSLLVRPVPRWSVLFSKFSAVTLYAGVCLLITYLVALLPALLLFEGETELGGVSLGFLASWLSDAAFIAIAALVCTFTTSVAWAVVGVVIVMIGELAARGALEAIEFFGQKWAGTTLEYMPGNALEAWKGFDEAWSAPGFGMLVGMLVVLGGAALARFQRTDVP